MIAATQPYILLNTSNIAASTRKKTSLRVKLAKIIVHQTNSKIASKQATEGLPVIEWSGTFKDAYTVPTYKSLPSEVRKAFERESANPLQIFKDALRLLREDKYGYIFKCAKGDDGSFHYIYGWHIANDERSSFFSWDGATLVEDEVTRLLTSDNELAALITPTGLAPTRSFWVRRMLDELS